MTKPKPKPKPKPKAKAKPKPAAKPKPKPKPKPLKFGTPEWRAKYAPKSRKKKNRCTSAPSTGPQAS